MNVPNNLGKCGAVLMFQVLFTFYGSFCAHLGNSTKKESNELYQIVGAFKEIFP